MVHVLQSCILKASSYLADPDNNKSANDHSYQGVHFFLLNNLVYSKHNILQIIKRFKSRNEMLLCRLFIMKQN